MKTAVVTTTIHVPRLLSDYADDAARHARAVEFFVVADRATPPEAETYCRDLTQESGVPVRWLGTARQVEILADAPRLRARLPWGCIQRRNVGHLLAWIEGFDAIIAIDDDNIRADDDHVGRHLAALAAGEIDSVSVESGWFNCCSLLVEAQDRPFFPRGYPLQQRGRAPAASSYFRSAARVVVNAGLWLGDPDVDAVTRLAMPVEAVALRRTDNLALAKGTWCPFNSQNTAVHRDVLPAWFLSPGVGRCDDIWGSYVARACMESMGHTVAFGRPLARHDRNAHDLFRDLDQERLGLRFTDGLCETLRTASFPGTDYATCALQAVTAVERWAARDRGMDRDARAAIMNFVDGYRSWVEVFQRLNRA